MESKTRTHHGRVGSGGAGQAGWDADVFFRTRHNRMPYRASETTVLNNYSEARTSDFLCKPNAGTKSPVDDRFTSGLRPVYHQDEKRSLFLAADQCTDAYLSLYKPFSCKACPGTTLRKHEQANSYVNRMQEQNHRLTTGLRPVYHRDEKRPLFLAADQCTDAYLSL